MRLKHVQTHLLTLVFIVSCGSGNRCEQACDTDHDDCIETTVSAEVCQKRREACEENCSEVTDEDDDTEDIIFCLLAAIFGDGCDEEDV